MDVSKFFDEIDHELMLKAVEAMIPEKWVRLYVYMWLIMKVLKADGSETDRGNKGTPQGGVISPLLANLFLHYGLNKWIERNYPEIRFVVTIHLSYVNRIAGFFKASQTLLFWSTAVSIIERMIA